MASQRTNEVRKGIVEAGDALLNTLSTSYGPKGLDKMLRQGKETTITNDGATIMKFFKTHPIHNVLSSVSHAQDTNCGDGTTSVVLLACSMLRQLHKESRNKQNFLKMDQALEEAKKKALDYIDGIKIEASDIMSVALTTLNSKVAAKSVKLAQAALEALNSCEMRDVKIMKKIGGESTDVEMHKGLIIPIRNELKCSTESLEKNLPVEKNILICQFCISAPKTNMDSKIDIKNYQQMEQFVREERDYVIKIIKKIKETKADLLVIQKSLLRESCSEIALHFFRKLGIAVINEVERADVDLLCRKLNLRAVSDVSLLRNNGCADKSFFIKKVSMQLDGEDFSTSLGTSKISKSFLKIFCDNSATISISGVDELMVEETERSLIDVLSVINVLKRDKFIVPGGCAVETGIGTILGNSPNMLMKEISTAFIMMAHFLSSNAGLYSVEVVNKLVKNLKNNPFLGISMRNSGKGTNDSVSISDMINEDNVIQPAEVSKSAILLAIETVETLLKVDDILPSKSLQNQ
ncbi:hypothetical protein NUSPORA_01069 [Nucleospora cyclopteri]